MSATKKEPKQEQTQTAEPKSDLEKLIEKDRSVSYTPFGESEELTLSMGQVRSYIATKSRTGKVPPDNEIIKFMMLCKARELNPWVGDAFLIGYENQQGEVKWSLIASIQSAG